MARVKSSLVTGLRAAMGSDEFVIVELTKDGPRPVYDHNGQLMKFSDGEGASREARAMTASGRKFQPRRVRDDQWHERELSRFASKEYKSLPWSGAVWWKNHAHIHGEHFPHVSQKNSVGLMAYTPSDAEGSADSQVPIKPGKYLEKYFAKVLDPFIIRDLCTAFSNVFEDNCLIFADTEDEFESLYVTGPSSCMSKAKDSYTSHIHPVRVYAAGDLALVYMKRDGRIVARALCFPAKKLYSRVYGDAGRIEPLLAKDGWKKGPPVGAKLQRVLTWENKREKSGNRAFVAPHIDDINWLMDEGDHLVIGNPGETPHKVKGVKLTGASGVTEWVSLQCRSCNKEVTASTLQRVYIDRMATHLQWCADCVNTHTFKCVGSGHRVINSEAVEMFDGSKMWRRLFDDGNGFICAGNGKNYPTQMRANVRDAAGKSISVSKQWYKESQCAPCKTCGNPVVAGGCDQPCKDRYAKQQEKMKALDTENLIQAGQTYAAQGSVTGQWSSSVNAVSQIDWANLEPRRR